MGPERGHRGHEGDEARLLGVQSGHVVSWRSGRRGSGCQHLSCQIHVFSRRQHGWPVLLYPWVVGHRALPRDRLVQDVQGGHILSKREDPVSLPGEQWVAGRGELLYV